MEKETKILVTGANGFLGKHLVRELNKSGYSNILSPSSSELNLLSSEETAGYVLSHRPEVIIHLAAVVGGIGANRKNPASFFHDNMEMGMNIITTATQLIPDLKKFVMLSTICAYPKFTPVPFKEEELWNGYPEETNAPYGIAKKALMVYGNACREQYGLPFITLMPVNLYGPGDHFHLENAHVVPVMIRKFQTAVDEGKHEVTLWGDGSPTREFLYALDCAEAIRLAMEIYDGEKPMNIGTGNEITMKELATIIAEETGFTGTIIWDASKPNGQPRRQLDTNFMSDTLKYLPPTDFDDGLRKTIEYWNSIKGEYKDA